MELPFASKYNKLLNSVPSPEPEMVALHNAIKTSIKERCCPQSADREVTCQYKHTIDVNDVAQAVTHIKLGKSDGHVGHCSDHTKYASGKLFIFISLLFNPIFMHGYAPHNMLISTIVPIFKNRKKSINDSDNYRGVALISVLGKVLDWVILKSYEKAPQTSDMQFGFKEKHSTTQCTFSMQETIQYYTNSGGPVYLLLLDAQRLLIEYNF